MSYRLFCRTFGSDLPQYAWESEYFRGQFCGGDALFAEIDRADSNILLLLVDVMGHGRSAAAIVRRLALQILQDPTLLNLPPNQLLTRLNAMLAPVWAETCTFVAATALLIDQKQVCITAAGAANPNPVCKLANGAAVTWKIPGGTPLGLPTEESVPYAQGDVELAVGDMLLCFTDGVTDARPPGAGPSFGSAGVRGFVGRQPCGVSPDQLVTSLWIELQALAQNEWAQDDTTILCLQG